MTCDLLVLEIFRLPEVLLVTAFNLINDHLFGVWCWYRHLIVSMLLYLLTSYLSFSLCWIQCLACDVLVGTLYDCHHIIFRILLTGLLFSSLHSDCCLLTWPVLIGFARLDALLSNKRLLCSKVWYSEVYWEMPKPITRWPSNWQTFMFGESDL